ncbi:MAG TPA: hypothetical protein PKV02_00275 [Bacteroidia bacterium]|nr:hypothetical protein [Bacteroidia bacterium]
MTDTERKGALEYMLIRLAQWHMQETGKTTFDEFNAYNDLSANKAMLFPFLISTANGDRVILFNEFCVRVFPHELGNFDRNHFESIDKLKHVSIGLFDMEVSNFGNLTVNSSREDIIAFLQLVITDTETFTGVVEGIDKSIDHIKNKLELPFLILLTCDAVSYLSKEHSSYKVFSAPEILALQPGNVIPTDFLISEKSPLAHEDKKRTFA